MTTSTLYAVQEAAARIERNLEAQGWSLGVGVWALYDSPDGDDEVLSVKLGGPAFSPQAPDELLAGLPPTPTPVKALVIAFEAQAITDPSEAPRDVRLVIGCNRDLNFVEVTRFRDAPKSRCVILPDNGRPASIPGLVFTAGGTVADLMRYLMGMEQLGNVLAQMGVVGVMYVQGDE